MNTKPIDPASKDAPDLERYMPGDPIPVPQAVEANTESTWAMFGDIPKLQEPDFEDTVPFSTLDEQTPAIPGKKSS